MELTKEQEYAVSDIKNILRGIIISNSGDDIDNILRIFKEIVNETYSDLQIKINKAELVGEKISVNIEIDKLIWDFDLYLNDGSDFETGIDALIMLCEPWRKTNPKLVESERKIKEWANSCED